MATDQELRCVISDLKDQAKDLRWAARLEMGELAHHLEITFQPHFDHPSGGGSAETFLDFWVSLEVFNAEDVVNGDKIIETGKLWQGYVYRSPLSFDVALAPTLPELVDALYERWVG